ncbi:MAG: hypothetical protein V4651_01045 [Bacteroidota bacterium]
MKQLLLTWILFTAFHLNAQVKEQIIDARRPATHKEVKMLAHLVDSVLTELKILYKLEQKENSPRKYQPDRIALVRSYLLIFQHIENSCSIVAYGKGDVSQIFGKPDTTFKVVTPEKVKEMEWRYGGLEKKYIRINNLRYRFYFKNSMLDRVKRDDK